MFYLIVGAAAAAALVLCLRAKAICTKLGLLDEPNARKIHRDPTPLMGGIILLFAFLPAALFQTLTTSSERWLGSEVVWLVCTGLIVLLGIVDDRHSLSPRSRLILSFSILGCAAVIDPTFNVRMLNFEHPYFTLGLGTWSVAVLFTVVCLVGLINAVNMADGKNGLVLGLCLGWIGLLASRAPAALLPNIIILFAIVGVLLIFNMKGKLFLGDGGAYGVAAAVGLLAIMIYNSPGEHALRAVSAEELLLLFFVPVFDSFRLTYVRMKQGKSPMAADRDHLHHHLQNNFGWPGGLFIYFALAFLPTVAIFAFA